MKKSCFFVFAVLFTLMLVVLACAPAAVVQSKKFTVAIDANYPPLDVVNEKTGQPDGFDVELMNAVAAKAGLDIEWVNTSFDQVVAGVASCKYDIGCSGISITEERKKDMLFSDPIHSGGQVVIVRKDNTDIKGIESLAGRTVAAQSAATSAAEGSKIPDVTLKTSTAITSVLQNLMDGQCDAAIADNEVAAFYTSKYPDKLKIVGPIFTDEKDGIAVCKKNKSLLPKINAALKSLKQDGTIDKLRSKWISGS